MIFPTVACVLPFPSNSLPFTTFFLSLSHFNQTVYPQRKKGGIFDSIDVCMHPWQPVYVYTPGSNRKADWRAYNHDNWFTGTGFPATTYCPVLYVLPKEHMIPIFLCLPIYFQHKYKGCIGKVPSNNRHIPRRFAN